MRACTWRCRKQNGFFREQQKPSASVLVSLYPGRILDRAQMAGIVHLVASSVPEMPPTAVSVLDDTGKLLSQSPDTASGSAVDAQQLLYVQQLEQQYTRRIMDILEPVVGRNNIKAQVTAELDFSQTESTSEQYRPNQTPDASAIRSQQVLESKETASARPRWRAGGCGQPAAGAVGRAHQRRQPGACRRQGQQQGHGAGAKRESTTNYEVDKTVRVVRGNNWAVKRLSAAVVVNYQSSEEKGKTITKALTPEQIEQMTALVRETIGFNKERGDSVNLMNAPFQVDVTPVTEVPLWKQPETVELARNLAWPLGMSLFAALVLLGLVRPALKALGQAQGHSDGGRPAGCRWRPSSPSGPPCRRPPKRTSCCRRRPSSCAWKMRACWRKREPDGGGQYCENLGQRRSRLMTTD